MARETAVQSQVKSYQRLKNCTWCCLAYHSVYKVSGAIHGIELRPPLHLGVVAIEKGAFVSLSIKVADFTFTLYSYLLSFFAKRWLKSVWMGYPMRIEHIPEGLLV